MSQLFVDQIEAKTSGGSTSIPVIVTVVSSDESSEQDLINNLL